MVGEEQGHLREEALDNPLHKKVDHDDHDKPGEDRHLVYTHMKFAIGYSGNRIIEVNLTSEEPRLVEPDKAQPHPLLLCDSRHLTVWWTGHPLFVRGGLGRGGHQLRPEMATIPRLQLL